MAKITDHTKLTATLSPVNTSRHLTGKLSNKNTIQGGVSYPRIDVTSDYSGEYEVASIPDSDQTLNTANRYLSRDIIVKAIPYAEVSNNAGGITATIGG